MTKEKTARLIPNAIQLSTDTEKVRRESAAQRPAVKRHDQSASLLMKVIREWRARRASASASLQTCSEMILLTKISRASRSKLSVSAFFHLVRGQGQDLHDDVQAVAERPAGQGQPVHSEPLVTFRKLFLMCPLLL